MANQKIEEYKKRLAEMYKAKSNDKLNTDENIETLLTPNKTPNDGNYSFGGTMAELGDNLLTGWFKGLEGMVDAGITVAGHVGSWFGSSTDWAEKAISIDATDALMNDMFGGMREKANESYTNLLPETFQQGYDGITTSIGQMLPSIALGAVGGALGAGSKVVQGISMASFGAGAMGTSVEEGLNEGATFNEATGYGILQGGKEIATEYIGGKLFDSKVFGVFGDTTKVGIKALAKEAIGEGMEEVISTAFDPIVRKITIDKDKSLGELYEGIGEEMAMSFITGAITGGIMGGASTSVQVARYGVDGVNAMNTVQEANEVVQKMVALEKTVVNNESKTQKMEGYKKELENLYDVYTSQIKNLETKYGADSKKAEKMNALSEYFSAIKNSSAQDLAIRDAIDEFNRKNKTNFKYNAYNQAEYTKIVKLIQGKNFDPSDAQSNAFILTDNGIVVNRDSEAYKEGRLYNTIGHEFIHSIEGTEGYQELFNNFVKGFTQEELNVKIQEYAVDRGYGTDKSAEYLLQEAFADYIGENVAINYKEFSKMLGTKSVWSKIKDTLTGYRSSLTTDLKQVQSKVSNALKTATDTSMEMAKASKGFQSTKKYLANANNTRQKYGNQAHRDIKQELLEIMDKTGQDFVNDAVIISENSIFIVDAGFDNGKLEYGIQDKIECDTDIQTLKEEYENAIKQKGTYSKRKNALGSRESKQSRPLSKRNGAINSNDGKSRESLQSVSNESKYNEGRISRGDESRGIKFSKKPIDSNGTKPKISEDYDTSKGFKFDTENESFSIKGLSWYEKKLEKLEELEYKLDDGEISENSYYNRMDKINESVQDEIDNLDYALREFESYDLENLGDYETIPSKKQIEKLLNYANQIEDFINGYFPDVSVDFSEFYDEESYIMQMYKELSNGVKTEKETTQKGEIDYEDEFRRIQEESNRMSDEELQRYRNGSKKISDEIYGRLSEVYRRRLDSFRSSNSDSSRVLKLNDFNIIENVDSKLFHDIFEINRCYLENGELVDLHNSYDDCICYISENGLSGFAIAPTGDLISVFNVGRQRGFLRAISSIVKEKATTLDCYVSSRQDLQSMYGRVFGFQTASIMDYNMEYDHDNIAQNHGMPQVAFMVNSKETIETKHFNKDQYEEAVDYQKQVLKEYPVLTSNSQVAVRESSKATTKNEVSTKEQLEQVEGEIVEPNISTEVRTESEAKSKVKKTQTPLTTDSTLAWKFYSNLVNDKVYNKSNADGFINAIEQDIKNKFGNDAKVDFKGNKEQLGKNLFQDLNNPSNVSKEQAVKHFLEYFSQIEVNGVSIKEALNNIDPVLYDDFIKQMNANLVSLFNSGTQSKMDKVISTYTNRINKLKEALREERDYAKELLKTVKVLKSTVAKHKGKNASMTSLDISNTIPELNTLIVELEQLLSRTDYLKSDFRSYMAKVKEAFTKNEYLQRAGYLDADLLADMDTIIQNSATLGNKKITKDEMKILRKICNAINKVYNEYDETVLNGKRVVASQEALDAIEQIKVKDQKGKNVVSKLNAVENLTGQNMRTKLTLMSNKTYEDSFGRKIMGSLEQASNKKKEIYFDLTDSYHKKMTDKRRNLVKKLEKSNFSFGGVKFNDAQIITLYMTALRGDVATRHLLGEGVRIRDKNGFQTKAIKLTQENLDNIRKYVESNYADFIVELKEIFHKKAGKYYNETLSTRTGYEDSLEANYFPMKSSDLDFTANVMDQSKLMAQYQEFLSPSFTKEVQKTANNSLIIESIDVVVETFSRTMSNFAGITPTIQHLNRLFNTPVEYNGQTTSLMQYIKENYYENFDKEFSRLLINMQDRRTTGSVNKLGARVRSGIASASLGGNPKIWFLQIASFPIAVSELGFFNSIRGVNSLPLDASKIAEISPYFKDRWENNDVRNAMLNTTNVAGKASTAIGKIGEFFSKPINWFSKMLDKAVIKSSIAKVARDNKMTIKQVRSNPQLLAEAVALAEQVCRRTQSQYDVLESGSTIYEASELMKSFYMFSSDARVIGNLLRTKLHDAISSKNFKPLLKAMTGVFLTQVIVALLDVAYRAFLDKTDDEDEDGKITDDMFHDFLIGTAENMTVNLIPIARDVYNKFVHGYDLNNVTLDYFNDLIDTISSMTNKLGSGETSEKDIYNFAKVFGTTFGIPVKNLSELVTAIFTKTNAEWAIRTQDILYSKSSSDSKNDIIYSYNNGKVSKLVGQTGALFSKAGLDTPNTKACTEMARLYSKGFTQIYPSVDISTFSHEGQLYKLSEAQQAKFSDIYNDATKELELLISSPAYYKLKDTDKAKAIKKVYSLYYSLAKAEFIQDYEYSPTEEALFELDAHDLVLYLVHIDSLKATTSLSKKEQVIRYLNRQGLNKKELEAIFNILGYKVNSSNSILGNSMLSNSLFN